jgi:hypothetical protein
MTLCLTLAGFSASAWPTLEFEPSQDNTLYETPIDAGETRRERSNGAGNFLFVGRTDSMPDSGCAAPC